MSIEGSPELSLPRETPEASQSAPVPLDAEAEALARQEPTVRSRRPSLEPVAPPRGVLPLGAIPSYALAVASGLLYWLAFAGMDIWPLALIAFAPLFVAMRRQPSRRAAFLGLIAGLTMNITGFSWLENMLVTFSGFPGYVCFLFVVLVCAYQGGRLALMGWLYARSTARGWPSRLCFVAAFAASELVYPLLFPWYFAATVHKVPVLTQTAEIGGPILVGVVLVVANLALAEPVVARLERRKLNVPVLGTCVGVVILALAFGALRVRMVDRDVAAAEAARVGVVQANMPLMEKRHNPGEGLRRHLAATSDLKPKIDFVVWSETSALGRGVLESEGDAQVEQQIGKKLGLPAIFGAVYMRTVPDRRRQYVLFNTALSTDASGKVTGRYDKQYLLMFGEYLPFGDEFPILYEWSPNSGRFSPGSSLEPLTIDLNNKKHPVSTLICYEDILPGFTNDMVRHAKPELLVNMTNDAWFGDTSEPWEHLALAQFRSIEHRLYLVRGTNSGVSAVVDPVGRVLHPSGTFKEDTVVATIHWLPGGTAYEILGDSPFYLATIALVLGAFRRRRGWKSAPPPA
jgi:apolipoprotein N-acyltransferase